MDRARVLAAAALAAIVAQPALATEPCLYSRQIISYKTLDRHTLIVRATGGKRYRLDLGGNCIGLDDVIGLGVRQRGPGLCVQTGDSIVYRFSGFGEQSCLITEVMLYAPPSSGDAQAPSN